MNRSIAERAADILSGVMLPLVSSTMPRLTGTRSLLKWRDLLACAVLVDGEVLLAQARTRSGRRRR